MRITKEQLEDLRAVETRQANLRLIDTARQSAISEANNEPEPGHGILWFLYWPAAAVFALCQWLFALFRKREINREYERKRNEIEDKM